MTTTATRTEAESAYIAGPGRTHHEKVVRAFVNRCIRQDRTLDRVHAAEEAVARSLGYPSMIAAYTVADGETTQDMMDRLATIHRHPAVQDAYAGLRPISKPAKWRAYDSAAWLQRYVLQTEDRCQTVADLAAVVGIAYSRPTR